MSLCCIGSTQKSNWGQGYLVGGLAWWKVCLKLEGEVKSQGFWKERNSASTLWREMVSVYYMPVRYPLLSCLLLLTPGVSTVYLDLTLTIILGVGEGKHTYCCNGEGVAGGRIVLVLPMFQFALSKSIFVSLGGQRERAPVDSES